MSRLANVLTALSKSAVDRGTVPSGMTTTQLLALPNGVYSNGNQSASGVLPTQYGVLVVLGGSVYYKLFVYFPTDATMKHAVSTPNSTSLNWRG